MPVEIWSKGQLEPRVIGDNLEDLVRAMNMADAKDQQFVILEKIDGSMCAIERRNITTMDEVDGAFIGR